MADRRPVEVSGAQPRGFAGDGPAPIGPTRGARRPSRLERPLTTLRGVGPRLAAAANGLGIETLGDLLGHVPHDYRDRSTVRPACELEPGERATLAVVVRSARVRPTRRRNLRIVEAQVDDGSGPLKAVWFNQAWLAEQLRPGTRLLITGRLDRQGFRVEQHELADANGAASGIHTLGLVPVHPAAEGIRPSRIREWVHRSLALATDSPEPLPGSTRARRRLPGRADALASVHFPSGREQAEVARRRLAFEELLVHQAALALRRRDRAAGRTAVALERPGGLVGDWLEALPFELTGAQRRALEDLDGDLAAGPPMQRLLMGDVGSGKTVVALYAMLRAVERGRQAALMAPTETLAEQHARTLDSLLGPAPVACSLLSQGVPGRARRELEARLGRGEPCVVVGTHALIEPHVAMPALAVAVVDEQHRFGVSQRAALDAKPADGLAPHTLHMTATPIPRTLSLTAYGDLDTTVLDELPAGRRPVGTWVVGEERREAAFDFLRKQLDQGRQAYVVCPLVTESEQLEARAAEAEAARLAAGELTDYEVGLLHGQMSPQAKREAMEAFEAGSTQALVATSVIEVGVDVPNATVIVVEGAERYGLAQLHQLRGRVGRSELESHCILFHGARTTETARRRLEAIAAERDGFRLAEIDLALRGEGEILGTAQHGLPRFRAAMLPEDAPLLLEAREEMTALKRAAEDPAWVEDPVLAPLFEAARERYGDERRGAIAA